MLEAPGDERRLGMGYYATGAEPLGGRLRDKVEDFVVKELSISPPQVEDGAYTAARITARNWETNRLVRGLSKALKLDRRGIFFAGTKDKRAISSQQFVFACPPGMLNDLELKGVRVEDIYPTDRSLVIGNLLGNSFEITLRGVKADPGDIASILMLNTTKLEEMGGFLNYFGVQRFGAIRPITHDVGEHILRGRFDRAVWTYLTAPGKGERPWDAEARARLRKHQDVSEALLQYPSDLLFERTLLGQLSRMPGDHIGALKALPANLLSMFVHAYQSYLFNQVLTERIRRGIPPETPVEGDLVIPVDADGVPDHHYTVLVKPNNLARVERKVRERRAFVSGVIPGSECPLAEGPMGEVERDVLEANDIRPGHFIVPELTRLSSRGMRRELIAPVRDLAYEVQHNCVRLSFTLFKGTYATSLLREYIKSPDLRDY
jgi:tRNA pseudouridine13 synthase